mmetsp:Transcript_145983/g.406697  ORF Transcript_145983/g.406697 Transcript_145983/m.406697 type:complete len:212 (+) Transcript_145983:227-862(+)
MMACILLIASLATHSPRAWEYASIPVSATIRPHHCSKEVFSWKTTTEKRIVATDLRLPKTVSVNEDVSFTSWTSTSKSRKAKRPGKMTRAAKLVGLWSSKKAASSRLSLSRTKGTQINVDAGAMYSTAVIASAALSSIIIWVTIHRRAAKTSDPITSAKPTMSKSGSPYDARNMPVDTKTTVLTSDTEHGSKQHTKAKKRTKTKDDDFMKV